MCCACVYYMYSRYVLCMCVQADENSLKLKLLRPDPASSMTYLQSDKTVIISSGIKKLTFGITCTRQLVAFCRDPY